MAHVQQANTGANYQVGAAIAVTFPATVTSGNAVVGLISYDNTITLNSVTDDKSNTYTILDTVNDTTNGQKTSTFVLGNITNAPKIITSNFSASGSFIFGAIDEYDSVLAASNPTDGHTGQLQSGVSNGTDTVTSGSVVTTTNGDQIWGGTADTLGGTGTATVAAGTGFTLRNSQGVGSFHNGMWTEDRTQTTAGSIAATFSPSTTGRSWTTFIIALKPASAATVAVGWWPGYQDAPPRKRTIFHDHAAFVATPSTLPVNISGMAWQAPQEPHPKRRRVIDDQAWAPQVIAQQVTAPPNGWFAQEDQRPIRKLRQDEPARAIAPPAQAPTGWFLQAADLPRPRLRYAQHDSAWAPQVFTAASTIAGMAWYAPAEPYPRRKPPPEPPISLTLTPATLPVPISGMGWYVQFDPPGPRRPSPLDQPSWFSVLVSVSPSSPAELHSIPFFAVPGSLMTR